MYDSQIIKIQFKINMGALKHTRKSLVEQNRKLTMTLQDILLNPRKYVKEGEYYDMALTKGQIERAESLIKNT